MLTQGLLNPRTSPHNLPSASPSAVLPGLSATQQQQPMDAAAAIMSQQSAQPQDALQSASATTPDSADSPSGNYPSLASATQLQSTIEKATSFISTSIPHGIIPGYPSVEFSHSPVGLTPSALWPSGWPQQAYYKQ